MVYIPKNPLSLEKAKRSKYRNKRVKFAGRTFDSVIERDRFFFLQQEQRHKNIRNLRCQVRYSLDQDGQHICDYIADFVYEAKADCWNTNGSMGVKWIPVVEDVKGGYKKLREFAIKEKLMLACHGITIRIVKSPTLPIG